MQTSKAWLAALCVAAAAGAARGAEVRLTVGNDARAGRTGGIVTCGVPFARGVVRDLGRLSATCAGKATPAQFTLLAPWDDGSVRWALLDTQVDVPAAGGTELLVRDDRGNRAPEAPVKVTRTPGAVEISTGPMRLAVDTKRFTLLSSVQVGGKELIGPGGGGLVLHTADGKRVAAGPPETVRVEQAGPMRAVVMLRGKFPRVHDGLLGYTVRISAYAGRPAVKLRVWLENHGQHGYAPRDKPYTAEWFAFDGLEVELGLSLGGAVTAECEGARATGKLKVLQICKPAKERHDPAYGYANMAYAVTSGTRTLKQGDRTDGVVSLTGSGVKLTAAIRHFWQNYEKAIELDGDKLRLWLWPTEGQWPRTFIGHACPGYATRQMHPLMKKGLYNLPGSVHKGHEVMLDFSGRVPGETSAELSRPLFALASAEYYASTEAAPGRFVPPRVRTGDAECDAKLDAWVRMTRSASDPQGASSIWRCRRDASKPGYQWAYGYAYGWMDFGDLPVPGSGTVSLHYDWPYVMMVNLLRTGDLNCLRLATEMVRHRVEVDQQWSDRARPEYRGFQRVGFTYAHFHCERFNYSAQPSVRSTWLVGPILYYMLTGDAKTLECIRRAVTFLPKEWERIFASDDYYMRRIPGDMQTVARSIFAYCAMYDLTGEKQWLDRATRMFHRCVLAKAKNLGPHLHDRNQIRSQGYTRDDVKYCYSIQAFCELHHHTDDPKVLALLRAGCDTEFPENFFDAPLFLADLNAYVALKTGKSDYLDRAVQHWIAAFPESKSPPVYLPANSQWSRRAAMILRTGHLLQYAHWKRPHGPRSAGR